MREKFELYKPIDSEVRMGTTNAGPWRELDQEPPAPVSFLSMLSYREGDHFWRVSDDEEGMCLTGDDIWPGDILHFRTDVRPNNGDIVLALGHDIDGRSFATTKHYYEKGITWRGHAAIELRPSNPKCVTIKAFPMNVEIQGVVESIIRVAARKRETMRRSKSR